MAVMDPLNPSAFEQKPLPVPSSEKMALDSDLNGSITHEIPLADPSPPESLKPANHLAATEPSADTVNGDLALETNSTDNTVEDAPVNGASTASAALPAVAPEFTSSSEAPPAVEARLSANENPVADTTPPSELQSSVMQDSFSAPVTAKSDLTASQEPSESLSRPEASAADVSEMGAEQSIQQDEPLPTTELPHHPPIPISSLPPETPVEPAPTPMESTIPSFQADEDMPDVVASPAKIAHERDEDDEDEDGPAVKRTRTEEGVDAPPEFKVPDIPAAAEPVLEPAVELTVESSPAISEMKEPTPTKDTTDLSPDITPAQKKYLLAMIRNLKRTKDSQAFNAPVDPVKLNIPTYFDVVKKPMDMTTIEDNLKADKYPTVEAVTVDFNQIILNTTAFNGPEHVVTKLALNLKAGFDRQMANLPKRDVVEPTAAEKKAKKIAAAPKPGPRRESRSAAAPQQGPASSPPAPAAPAASASSPVGGQPFALLGGVPVIRRDSTAGDGRPKREIHAPAPKDLPYSVSKPRKKKFQVELKFCEKVMAEMNKPKYQSIAYPFYNPVDPVALNIPHYHKVIKKPMDLGTIGSKLKTGQYENAKEFESDMRLMFQNCYKFNPAGDPVNKMGKDLEAVFDEEWSKKQKFIDDHTPRSNPASARSSVEPEEDDEEDEDEEEDEDNQLMILQRQIEAMSKQVEMIQKKKASPVPGKKARGAKATKKGDKKAGGSKTMLKIEKKPKSKAPSRIPYVTYDQKQEISTLISTLSANRMQQALRIIRENMPNLPESQEEEIELDIDELSNEVLYSLLMFVRKYAPHGNASREDEAPRPKARSEKASASKPKKNKPMSKQEQEARISELQGKLMTYKNAGSSEEPEPVTKRDFDSSASESESGSESEEE